MTDQTLSDTDQAAPAATTVFGTPTPEPTPDVALTLDEVLNEARLVERVAKICLRGDLEAQRAEILRELASLIDPEGNIVSEGDQALADQSRAEDLLEQDKHVTDQMRAAMRTVRFRAMPDDEWDVFKQKHRDPKTDKPKDLNDWNRKIIARCAIAPTFTEAEVDQIRGKLSAPQFATLANEAYWACTTGGLDIPKSSASSQRPPRLVSGRS